MPAVSKKTGKKGVDVAVHKDVKDGLPSWPMLEPKPPLEDMALQDVLQGQIVTVPGFWTPALCKKYVAFLSGLPLVTTPGKPKKGEAVRVNDRYQVDDATFAERLWSETGLKDLVMKAGVDDGVDQAELQKSQRDQWGGIPCGLSPNIRIYRYSPGQYFDQHYDDSNLLIHPGPPSVPARTTWTLLLYLTSPASGCQGGETVFYPEPYSAPGKKGKKERVQPEPIAVGLETGMALLHKHGKDCLLHEGREVTQGEKWVIRTDLCVGR